MTAFDIPGWDSLTHIKIILAIEKHFAVKFRASEVVALQNVGDLYNKIREKIDAKRS
jgi:acyl carrier protein